MKALPLPALVSARSDAVVATLLVSGNFSRPTLMMRRVRMPKLFVVMLAPSRASWTLDRALS